MYKLILIKKLCSLDILAKLPGEGGGNPRMEYVQQSSSQVRFRVL